MILLNLYLAIYLNHFANMLSIWVYDFDLNIWCERGSFCNVGSVKEVPVKLDHVDDFGVARVDKIGFRS